MRHLTYLILLLGCLAATSALEWKLDARVYRRWRRAVRAVVPVAVVFAGWDVLAIRAHWWSYDHRYLVGGDLPGRLPVEELLFFVVVPLCAILTFEAVRRLRPDWFGRLVDDRPAEDALAELDGAELDGAQLDGAKLDRAQLDGAKLDRAKLDRARSDGDAGAAP